MDLSMCATTYNENGWFSWTRTSAVGKTSVEPTLGDNAELH